MAARAAGRRSRPIEVPAPQSRWKTLLLRYLPGWIALALAFIILLPRTLSITLVETERLLSAVPEWISENLSGPTSIAPLFTPEVRYWSANIARWASEYSLDPNLLATVMQIESCGHPSVSSNAGAQGLFQVMPFHFTADENQLDPDTNARRGANYLKICIGAANGDPGLALACYNGGQSVINQPFAAWQAQTQRYYHWGTGIYSDAQSNQSHSDTLDQWLAAGGSNLCQRAGAALGL